MHDTTKSGVVRGFYLVSTLVPSETPEETKDRAARVASDLRDRDTPFNQFELKVAGSSSLDSHPVFLLSEHDFVEVDRLALENFQKHYIKVVPSQIGYRTNVETGQQEAIGYLDLRQRAFLNPGTAYLERDGDSSVWAWTEVSK